MEIRFLSESSVILTIDSKLYSSEVIHKCFYWYGDNYSININLDGDNFKVNLIELSNEGEITKILPKIKRDLIDFKTREIISRETKNVRELLIAKAFAHGDEYDEVPSGDINDPFGFDPFKF